MLEEKVRNNLYKIIEQYYKILKKQYKKVNLEYSLIEIPNEIKQSIDNYEISIFKYINNKQIPFTELFKLSQGRIYTLNEFETELLRNYIGIYDNGKKQSVQDVSKRLNITTSKASHTLKQIMDMFESETGQLLLINERNKEIKNRIYNEEYKMKILNSDITFLNITDNFLEILREENINTVGDLLKITKTRVQNMNIKYGYFDNLEIIPQRLIHEIDELGLKFEKQKMIDAMFKKFKDEQKNDKKSNAIINAISARQFEPELLDKMNSINDSRIDLILNTNCIQEKYMEFKSIEIQEKIRIMKMKEIDYRHGKIYQSDNN